MRFGVRTHWSRWTLDADETWSSSMYADDQNTQVIPGWGSGDLDLRATWTVEVGDLRLQPYASVNNLLNQAYIGSVTINGAGGRTIEPAPLRSTTAWMEIPGGAPVAKNEGPKTEDRRPRTEDRRPKAEDRGSKTEDRTAQPVTVRGSRVEDRGEGGVRDPAHPKG